jgi:3-hydroxyacyl-[acyl-carrier-protein] dehydratase
MIFEGNLYRVSSREFNGEELKATLRIDAAHPLFGGHFPGSPVLPGVCTLQIATELICSSIGKPYRLSKCENLKFIRLVVPGTETLLDYAMRISREESGALSVHCTVTAAGEEVFKMKGRYECQNG